MRRWRWTWAVCALLGVAPVAAQAPPDGYRVRIGPEGPPADDPLAPAFVPDAGLEEADAALDAPEATADAPEAPAVRPKRKRSKKARKKRRERWKQDGTVTPLEAAQRLDATPGEAIEFARALTFRHDSVRLTDEAAAALDEALDYLQASPEIRLVLIEGHTDAAGSLRYNQALSEARAAAVRKALVARGVAPERLVAYGYGETRPATPERAANRRVVFRVIEGDRKALARRVATEWGQAAVVDASGAVQVAASPEAGGEPGVVGDVESASPGTPPPSTAVERPAGAIALRIAPPASERAAPRPARSSSAGAAPMAPEGALRWAPADIRSQIAEGHDVRTDADGWALLRLPDLGRLWLGPDTRIRLSKLFHDHATGKTYLSIRVQRGTVRAMLNPLERGISRSLVALPGGSLEAVAADFELAVAPDGTGRIRVDRGHLDAADGGARSRPIYAGQAMRLGDAAPRPQLAPPTATAPLRGRLARPPALVWQPVPEAAGYVVEVAEDVDFYRPVLRAPTPDARLDLQVLAPEREHYWRVRAIDDHGLLGAASRIHAFRTAAREETPPAAARADPAPRRRPR